MDEQKQLIIENENLMKEELREHKRVNTIKQEISQLQSSFPQDKQNRLDTMFELVRFSDPNTENNLFWLTSCKQSWTVEMTQTIKNTFKKRFKKVRKKYRKSNQLFNTKHVKDNHHHLRHCTTKLLLLQVK